MQVQTRCNQLHQDTLSVLGYKRNAYLKMIFVFLLASYYSTHQHWITLMFLNEDVAHGMLGSKLAARCSGSRMGV